jgi:hypothetical protein
MIIDFKSFNENIIIARSIDDVFNYSNKHDICNYFSEILLEYWDSNSLLIKDDIKKIDNFLNKNYEIESIKKYFNEIGTRRELINIFENDNHFLNKLNELLNSFNTLETKTKLIDKFNSKT